VADQNGQPWDGPRKHSLHRPQLGAEVSSYVRDLIVSGRLLGGDFIRPEAIAQDLQISVTPVREGLLALRTQGFLRLEPRRGFVVIPLTGGDIRDLFAGQALLAGELAARAVKLGKAADIANLEQLHAHLEAVAEQGGADELEELNFRFHRAVNLLAASPKLAWLLGIAVCYVPVRFYASIDGWPAATVNDHHAVLDAFRRGASKAARIAMTEHIVHAGELLAIHIESIGAQQGAGGHPEEPAQPAPVLARPDR
jgi:DNA-binding GntR family transcriptional regulator